MAKEIIGLIKLQVRGGTANPSPPVGPALGAKGVNIMEFCKQFNARTQDRQGKLLPTVITVYADKSFDFVIKTPPAAVQLMEAAKLKKGSSESNRVSVILNLSIPLLCMKLLISKVFDEVLSLITDFSSFMLCGI